MSVFIVGKAVVKKTGLERHIPIKENRSMQLRYIELGGSPGQVVKGGVSY